MSKFFTALFLSMLLCKANRLTQPLETTSEAGINRIKIQWTSSWMVKDLQEVSISAAVQSGVRSNYFAGVHLQLQQRPGEFFKDRAMGAGLDLAVKNGSLYFESGFFLKQIRHISIKIPEGSFYLLPAWLYSGKSIELKIKSKSQFNYSVSRKHFANISSCELSKCGRFIGLSMENSLYINRVGFYSGLNYKNYLIRADIKLIPAEYMTTTSWAGKKYGWSLLWNWMPAVGNSAAVCFSFKL